MVLYRNLVFILLAVFFAGIVWICLVDPSTVASRIAAGLITGSFVGAINTFANYIHLRVSFFDKVASTLIEIGYELGHDLIDARRMNEELVSLSKREIITRYSNQSQQEQKVANLMREDYDRLVNSIDLNTFSCMFPSDKRVISALYDLNRLLREVQFMPTHYWTCRSFSSMSSKYSENEQATWNGDPNGFYDDFVQGSIYYLDIVESNLKRLGEVGESLSSSLKGTVSSENRTHLLAVKELSTEYLENKRFRNALKGDDEAAIDVENR